MTDTQWLALALLAVLWTVGVLGYGVWLGYRLRATRYYERGYLDGHEGRYRVPTPTETEVGPIRLRMVQPVEGE